MCWTTVATQLDLTRRAHQPTTTSSTTSRRHCPLRGSKKSHIDCAQPCPISVAMSPQICQRTSNPRSVSLAWVRWAVCTRRVCRAPAGKSEHPIIAELHGVCRRSLLNLSSSARFANVHSSPCRIHVCDRPEKYEQLKADMQGESLSRGSLRHFDQAANRLPVPRAASLFPS